MVTRTCFAFVATLLLPLLLASPGQTALIEINNRGALGANDFIDWGTLGPPIVTFPPNPFGVTSDGGLGATVSNPGGGFQRLDQGPSFAVGGWPGNFAPGDRLVWNFSNLPSTMTIAFSTPVAGAGAQLQYGFDLVGNPIGGITATLEAFDSSNNLLGSFSEALSASSNGDNSATFLGVLSSTANIDHITYSMNDTGFAFLFGFAVNQLDLVTTASVPEPTGLLLFGTIAAGLVLTRWRQGGEQHDHA